MPRQDLHHEAIKSALIKAGWKITHDPFVIRLEDVKLYIDLAAEKENEIAVEIKVFGGISFMNEFEKAYGQYMLYRQFLEEMFPLRVLFPAISEDVFEKSFMLPTIQSVVKKQKIKLLIFDPEKQEIVRWIS